MSIFSGKKGFIIRCVISFLFMLASALSIKLFFSYFPPTMEQLVPLSEKKALLIAFYSSLFPLILLLSFWIVLGGKIKGSLDNIFRFFISSVLMFFIFVMNVFIMKKQEFLSFMLVDIPKRLDQVGRDAVIDQLKLSADTFVGESYTLSILVLIISTLYLYSFVSLVIKAGKDATAKYRTLP